MNELDLRAEIVEQWGGPDCIGSEQWDTAVRLARISMIAWNALASPPNGEDLTDMAAAAAWVGTRSVQPRMVLRKLIEQAEAKHAWVPTPGVLRAAGRQVRQP